MVRGLEWRNSRNEAEWERTDHWLPGTQMKGHPQIHIFSRNHLKIRIIETCWNSTKSQPKCLWILFFVVPKCEWRSYIPCPLSQAKGKTLDPSPPSAEGRPGVTFWSQAGEGVQGIVTCISAFSFSSQLLSHPYQLGLWFFLGAFSDLFSDKFNILITYFYQSTYKELNTFVQQNWKIQNEEMVRGLVSDLIPLSLLERRKHSLSPRISLM